LRRPTSGCRPGPRRPPGQLARLRLFKLKRGAGELGDSAAGSERRRLFNRTGPDFGAYSCLGLVRVSLPVRAPQLGLRLTIMISLGAPRAAEARWPRARASGKQPRGPLRVASRPRVLRGHPAAGAPACPGRQLEVAQSAGDSEPDPRLGRVREQDFEEPEAPSHRSAQRHRYAARCAAGPLFTD
jgi:hypothetical protein